MIRKTGLIVCVLGIIATALSAFEERNTDFSEYKVNSGDALRLFVYDGYFRPSSNQFISNFYDSEYIVDGFGEIHLFSIGKIYVKGVTIAEISRKLEKMLEPYAEEPRVVIVPLTRLILRGGFNEPGMYRFKLNISFWEMVEEAGGLSTRSRFEEIYIERRGEMIYEDFWNAFYDASSLYELGIQSGDQIVAPIINRISFYTIMRYVSFGMSVLTFYFTFLNYRQR